MDFQILDALPFVNTGVGLAIATVALRYMIATRKLKIEERKEASASRLAEEAADRFGNQEFIALLRDEIVNSRAEVARAREEHRECDQRLSSQQSEILVLQRQMIAISLRYAIPIADVPPSVRSALSTIAEVLSEKTE